MGLRSLNAKPAPTILLRKHSLPITSFLPLLKNRHFVPAAVAFTSILSEFLIVSLSGLPYREGQTRGEFLFCGIASLFILIVVCTMVLVINVWRCFLPDLPRKPDTVAAVLTYVVDTRFCCDFEGLERMNVKERDRQVIAMGKRYGFGNVSGSNGEERWVVDEVGDAVPSSEYYGTYQKVTGSSRNASGVNEQSGLMTTNHGFN
jgi:hypothetical protein